jgi:hypothetical protein
MRDSSATKLNRAFALMRQKNVLVLRDVTCPRGRFAKNLCTVAEEKEKAALETNPNIIGSVFYANGGTKDFLAGKDLYLNHGPAGREMDASIGEIVAECCREAGLGVEWNGTYFRSVTVRRFNI